MPIRLASLLLVLLACRGHGQAPAGFRTFTDEDTGLEFYAPVDYVQIPLAPTESALCARFQRKSVPDEIAADKKTYKPEISAYCFRLITGTTSSGDDPEVPPTDDSPKTIREAMEQGSLVSNFSEFKKKRLAGLKVEAVPGKPGVFNLFPETGPPDAFVGLLFSREEQGMSFGVYGVTLKVHATRFRATLQTMASGLKLPIRSARAEDIAAQDAALERLYHASKFGGIEHRKKVRKNLAYGWKAIDTENYILVHHSNDEKLISKIARDIEAMRALYAQLFPAVNRIDTVSIVRVCRNRAEFLAYGGPPTAGGYWHPGNEELVFYDYEQTMLDNERAGVAGRKTTDKDSFIVLYHEAFHQYIHYAVGEIAPHDWFNEGHGDYFSGAVIPQYGAKVERVAPSAWRIHRAKDQSELGKNPVALKDLLKAERKDYYNPARVADFYAAGWSFIYFLRESKEVQKHVRWSRLLSDYFDMLKTAYLEEIQGKGETPNLADKQAAQETARRRALKAFLEDTDVDALEAVWKSFVVRLKDPWPERRKK